jgi:hypothetical protein
MASLIGKADSTLVTAAAREGLSNVPGDYSKQFGIMADANKTLLVGVEKAFKQYEADKKASKKELEDAVKDLKTYGVGIENNADYNMFSDEMDAQVAIWKENGGFQNDSKGLREWERQNNKIMSKHKSNRTGIIEAMEKFDASDSWIGGLEPGDNKFLTSLTKYAKNVDDKSGAHNANATNYMANNTGATDDKTPTDLWNHLGAEEGEMVKYLDPTTNEFTYITSVDGEVIAKKSSELSGMIDKKAITTETTIQGRLNTIAENPTGTYTDNDSLMNQNWLERVIDEAVQKGESLQYLMNQKYGGMEESFADSLRNGTAAISPAIIQSLSDLGYTVKDQAEGEEGHGVLDKNDFMAGTNYNAIVNEILNGEDTYKLRRDLFIDKLDNEVFRHEAEQVSRKTDKTDYGMAMPKHLGGQYRSNEVVRDQANKLQTYGKGRNIVMEDDNYTVVEPGKTFKGTDDEIYTLQQVWDNNAMPSGLKTSAVPSQQSQTPEIETETDNDGVILPKKDLKKTADQLKKAKEYIKGKKYTYINETGQRVPIPASGLDATGMPVGQWKDIKPVKKSLDKKLLDTIEASDLEITEEKTYTQSGSRTIYYNYKGDDINAAKKALVKAKGTTGIDNAFIKYENNGKQISKIEYEKLKDKSNVTFKVQLGVVQGEVDTSDPSTVVTDDMDNYTGQGTYTWESGDNYVGEWKDGLKNGQGAYIYADNGDKYVGGFKDDTMHGKGVWTLDGEEEVSWYWEGNELDGGEKEFLEKQKGSKKKETTKEVVTAEVENAEDQVAGPNNPDPMFGSPSTDGTQMMGSDGEWVKIDSEAYYKDLGIKSKKGKDFVKEEGVMNKVSEIASNHGFNVRQLLGIIRNESSFDTRGRNPNKGATGLIQFYKDPNSPEVETGESYKTINGVKYKLDDIKEMSVLEQLDLVDEYFTEMHTKGEHPYVTVAMGKSLVNFGMDQIYATPDSTGYPGDVWRKNKSWRDDNGNITKRSIIEYGEKQA